jgi:hypothetical protein
MIKTIIKDDYEIVRSRFQIYASVIEHLLQHKLTISLYKVSDESKVVVALIFSEEKLSLNSQSRNF